MNIAHATIIRMANWRERDIIGSARFLDGRPIYRLISNLSQPFPRSRGKPEAAHAASPAASFYRFNPAVSRRRQAALQAAGERLIGQGLGRPT